MGQLRDLNRWREQVGRSLLNLDFRPEGDYPFRFQMSPILASDGVRVVQNAHGPGYTFRDKKMVKDGNGSLALVYPRRGSLHFTQEGGGALRRSNAKLIVCNRPGQLGARTSCDYVSIIFQPEDLPPELDIERLAKSPWHAAAPALCLLRSYINTLNGTFIPPQSALAGVTHQHVLDLVRLAACEQSQSPFTRLGTTATIGEARVRIAREDIAKGFRDPGLTEGQIAAQQGITPRHLQRIFECAGLSFTGEVNALRLEAAYRALTDRVSNGRSVMEIAYRAGFSDVSHFNRLFRRRYGATPSEVRGRRN
jgi:AraC-like DNA-binding protein